MRVLRFTLRMTIVSMLTIVGGLASAEDRVDIVLTDVTEASGFGEAKGDRFSFGDFDSDGDPDLLVQGKTLWRNDTKDFGKTNAEIRFTNVTGPTGMGKGPGGGACWVDIDGDGDLDVVTTGGGIKIQHAAGKFRNEADTWGVKLEKAMASVGVGDVDGDGRADLLFGGAEDWNDGNPKYYARVLYRNVDGKRFRDVTAEHDLEGGRYGRAVAFADYDRDGDLDVYLGNYRLMANELLVNEAGKLVNRAETLGVAGRQSDDRAVLPDGSSVGYHWGHTIAASWADLDADGDLDLWVSNLVHKFAGEHQGRYDVRGWICDDSAIYRNDGVPTWGFTDMRPGSGIPLKPTGGPNDFRGDELWSNAACADLDGDGLPEVFVTQVYDLPYSHSLLFRNLGDLRFEEISKSAGVRRFASYGGAFADVDGDGDVDLVCNGRPEPKGKPSLCLYRNDTPQGPWVAFRVRGPNDDPRPIGAEVVLITDHGRSVQQVDGAMGSYAQQNEGVVRFGLRGRKVKEAWVRWPGGVLRQLRRVNPGRVHKVSYPTTKMPKVKADKPRRKADGTWFLKAKPPRQGSWTWSFDLDGDGTFETPCGGSIRVTVAARTEVRAWRWHRGKRVGREVIWRLEASEDN